MKSHLDIDSCVLSHCSLHSQTTASYEAEEQITHQTFKFDPNDLGNEKEYTSVKAGIQGKDSKEPSGHHSLMYKVEVYCI